MHYCLIVSILRSMRIVSILVLLQPFINLLLPDSSFLSKQVLFLYSSIELSGDLVEATTDRSLGSIFQSVGTFVTHKGYKEMSTKHFIAFKLAGDNAVGV